MKRPKALAHLDAALEEVRRLIASPPHSRSMDAWHRKTKIALEHIFGADSRQLKDFDDVSYSLPMWTTSTPDHVFEEAKLDGLRSAERVLQSLRDEITTFGISGPRGAAPHGVANVELDRITIPVLLHGVRRLTIKSWLLVWAVVASIFSLGSLVTTLRHSPAHAAVADSLRRQIRITDSLQAAASVLSLRLQRADSTLQRERDSLGNISPPKQRNSRPK